MRSRWIWRAAVLLLILTAIAWMTLREPETVLGVELISIEEAAAYTNNINQNMDVPLRYNKETACVDVSTSTIYLSQNIREGTTPYELAGSLELEMEEGALYFVQEEAFDHFSQSVAQGHCFTLLVINESGQCRQYNVVFTTLPIIMMTADGANEENITGVVRLWDPYDEKTGGISAVSTRAEWHIRGYSSLSYAKKSWKLSLKNDSGEKRNIDLLGLGADDDWILNSMNMDDARIKDKLAMDIWNSIAATKENDYPASTGEYVELFLNGEYRGVYLLQRRIDRKYLGLSDEILFKGSNNWVPNTAMEAYEIIYSTMNYASTYELMTDLWTDASRLDLDSFLDINILLQLGCMPDNAGNKNMYYLVRQIEGEYRIVMIPWDMDMSFAIVWDDRFVYDYDGSLNDSIRRQEYDDVQVLYPDLDERVAERWFELRKGALSWDALSSILYEAENALVNSGAYERDADLWPAHYEGLDSHDSLERWLWERLQWCDEYYSS